jgi:hypothetical protein
MGSDSQDLDSRDYIALRDRIFAAMGMSLRIGEAGTPSGNDKSKPPSPGTPATGGSAWERESIGAPEY